MNPKTVLLYFCIVLLSCFSLTWAGFSNNNNFQYQLVAELNGTFPGNPSEGAGDVFGATVVLNKKDFIVAATSASPQGQPDAGAIYFFKQVNTNDDDDDDSHEWIESQDPFIVPIAHNQVGSVILASDERWLFTQALGTPLDSFGPKNFAGVVLVFRKQHGQWIWWQNITSPSGPFSFFGLNLDYDGGDWLVIGGAAVPTGYVYHLNCETLQWEFFQALETPSSFVGYVFPTISKNRHIIINEPMGIEVDRNGKLFTYRLKTYKNGTQTWIYTQTLEGINNPISPLYGTGDFLGNFLDSSRDWLVAAASYDNEKGDFTGAVYFFHYERARQCNTNNDNEKQWVLKQKVFSEDPNVLYGFGVAIDHDIAVISDTGLTINNNTFQGAGVVYLLDDQCWKRVPGVELTDPNGKPNQFWGGGGVDVDSRKGARRIALGTDPISMIYLPSGFPNKIPGPPFNPPLDNGKALIFEYDYN